MLRRRHRPIAGHPGRCRLGPLALDRRRWAAGEVLSGRVSALDSAASVSVLRVERQPGDEHVYEIASGQALPPDGTFELAIPDDALPSAEGKGCRLRYVVSARAAARAVAGAEVVIVASARPHLEAGSAHADRLLASWDARNFHIELWDAQLEGGGRLAGRVHRHGAWPAGDIVATARCLECWRRVSLADRGAPLWRSTTLWEESRALRVDPDATWSPFEFDPPDGLPPAVEASTLAWRYELVAQRAVRHWFDETAALTALLHDPRS